MKLEKRLVVTEWEEIGELGWFIPGSGEAYDPSGYPPGLAHDLLEHFALESVQDEFEAMGVMYWGRYLPGFMLKNQYNSIRVASFSDEFENHFHGLSVDDWIGDYPEELPLEDSIEEDLEEIIQGGMRNLIEGDFDLEQAQRIEAAYPHFFRKGFRQAEERYKSIGPNGFGDLFRELVELFENHQPEREYQEMHLTIDFETGIIECECEEDYE
jgi:hypothetical protein